MDKGSSRFIRHTRALYLPASRFSHQPNLSTGLYPIPAIFLGGRTSGAALFSLKNKERIPCKTFEDYRHSCFPVCHMVSFVRSALPNPSADLEQTSRLSRRLEMIFAILSLFQYYATIEIAPETPCALRPQPFALASLRSYLHIHSTTTQPWTETNRVEWTNQVPNTWSQEFWCPRSFRYRLAAS
ncbi:hypothetical protein BDN72DRAFT_108618 [Pluteus cervinus]|uniref:Uncharacterized protein n=1 Tax=Pluteus cervinus TaxID=181527 RepID=A0ACD3ANI0_9AGAR|nr:hypothetical protein BDN72DRAFT_108618 [Pluteus cervinus]